MSQSKREKAHRLEVRYTRYCLFTHRSKMLASWYPDFVIGFFPCHEPFLPRRSQYGKVVKNISSQVKLLGSESRLSIISCVTHAKDLSLRMARVGQQALSEDKPHTHIHIVLFSSIWLHSQELEFCSFKTSKYF